MKEKKRRIISFDDISSRTEFSLAKVFDRTSTVKSKEQKESKEERKD
ncbi:hypothetical protein GCM10010954_14530 [Halobacillus andaensis]|uniref:Uncharacterized protein n=1 Tax=Halobacillus andaensis TaxID=1176239 RepID=A0A917EU91_HALAA|nr:hypothetical protein [Halobacillus andaensis]MBP2004257.1 hypothetical protein [Halobacillus andaensis]GGF16968.1 hypothetical protein GCM10010954_14530 [Halobacillus andaensis]